MQKAFTGGSRPDHLPQGNYLAATVFADVKDESDEAVRVVLLNQEWTGGAQGMSVPKVLTPAVAWIALAVVAYWFWRQGRSRYGRALEGTVTVRGDNARGFEFEGARLLVPFASFGLGSVEATALAIPHPPVTSVLKTLLFVVAPVETTPRASGTSTASIAPRAIAWWWPRYVANT